MRTLIRGSPTMFVLALAWATDNAEVVDVVAVCAAIQRQVSLKDAYPGEHLPPLLSQAMHARNHASVSSAAGIPVEYSSLPDSALMQEYLGAADDSVRVLVSARCFRWNCHQHSQAPKLSCRH